MNSNEKVLVVKPSSIVEPSWLGDIVAGNIALVVFRGFVEANVVNKVVTDLHVCRGSLVVSEYSNASLTTLGPYLAKSLRNLVGYFSEAKKIQAVLPSTLLEYRRFVYELLQRVFVLDSLVPAFDLGRGMYSGSIVRFHCHGVSNPLHNDNILRDAADLQLGVADVKHQLSCVACLQECDSGGALRIYEKKWQPEDEFFKVEGELGYRAQVVEGFDFCEFRPRQGDIYVFNPTYYHEIDRVLGDARITLGFFFGVANEDVKKAIAWS